MCSLDMKNLQIPARVEAELQPLCTYIAAFGGAPLPFRTPLPEERLRDCGIGDYFDTPKLQKIASPKLVIAMTGNIFKPSAFAAVWGDTQGPLVQLALHKGPVPPTLPPLTHQQMYQEY